MDFPAANLEYRARLHVDRPEADRQRIDARHSDDLHRPHLAAMKEHRISEDDSLLLVHDQRPPWLDLGDVHPASRVHARLAAESQKLRHCWAQRAAVGPLLRKRFVGCRLHPVLVALAVIRKWRELAV